MNYDRYKMSSVIVSLSELQNSKQFIESQETMHKNAIASIATLTQDVLHPILMKWGLTGFQNDYVIWQLIIGPPVICSDGEKRQFIEYVFYLDSDLAGVVKKLEERLPGMSLSHSFGINTINIHVRKNE